MSALTANREVAHFPDQELRQLPVEASAKIFKGAFVGKSADGHAKALAATDLFLGLAYEAMDNTGGADAAKKVRVYTQGDFELPLSGASQATVGVAIYASDDQTCTTTSSGNSFIGTCSGFLSAGIILVRIQPFMAIP